MHSFRPFVNQILTGWAAAAVLWLSVTPGEAGPCTAQINELQQQIASPASTPEGGPSAPQSVGAQLHHQPTPGSVERGQIKANAEADAALERARKADGEGNAAACDEALRQARSLYGID